MNKPNELTEDVMKAISVLRSGDIIKSKQKEGKVDLLSIVKKVARNREKGQ